MTNLIILADSQKANNIGLIIGFSIALVVLVFLSMVFSSADMTYGSIPLAKLKHNLNANPKNKSLKRAVRLSKNYDKTISTILFFNDTINAGLDSIATLLGIAVCANLVGQVEADGSLGETFGLAFSMGVLVFKILFGEIIAKSLGRIFNEKFAKTYSFLILVCYYITLPITFVVSSFGSLLTYPVKKYVTDIQFTEEELHEMIDEIEEKGVIDEDHADIIRGTIDYTRTEAYEILTPRANIFAIDVETEIEELLKDKRTFKHSKLPVFEENIDNIIGFIRNKDLIKIYLENKKITEDEKQISLRSIVQTISFVPRTYEINDLLKDFFKEKKNIAVVLDEYGGTEGIITAEDILEEIVGEIWDETDTPDQPYTELNNGQYIVDGAMNLEDFFDLFDIIDDDISTEYVTIGGFIIQLLDDNFAKVGDIIKFKNLTLEVVALKHHNTVKKILITIDDKDEE